MNKEHISNNPRNQQLNIAGAMPRFCFICGSKLEECGMGYYQCQSEECGEVYLPYIEDFRNENLSVMHIRTPFSPK